MCSFGASLANCAIPQMQYLRCASVKTFFALRNLKINVLLYAIHLNNLEHSTCKSNNEPIPLSKAINFSLERNFFPISKYWSYYSIRDGETLTHYQRRETVISKNKVFILVWGANTENICQNQRRIQSDLQNIKGRSIAIPIFLLDLQGLLKP